MLGGKSFYTAGQSRDQSERRGAEHRTPNIEHRTLNHRTRGWYNPSTRQTPHERWLFLKWKPSGEASERVSEAVRLQWNRQEQAEEKGKGEVELLNMHLWTSNLNRLCDNHRRRCLPMVAPIHDCGKSPRDIEYGACVPWPILIEVNGIGQGQDP